MTEIADISPPHTPISLARGMVELARDPEATGAFAFIIRNDGSMWYDSAGYRCADLLWALERMKLEILSGEG